jgi:hypothetical protein
MVVAVMRKLCSRCNRDVTQSPRLKDASGEYFCQPCWLEVCEAQGKEPAYQCGVCGEQFADDQVYQEKTQYICKACFAARNADPAEKAVAMLSGLAAAEESPDTAIAYAPSYYTATVRARNEQQARRTRITIIATVVGATILIVGLTWLLAWYRSS